MAPGAKVVINWPWLGRKGARQANDLSTMRTTMLQAGSAQPFGIDAAGYMCSTFSVHSKNAYVLDPLGIA